MEIPGLDYHAAAYCWLAKPDIQGIDVEPLRDGAWYGLLMANTYIMVVTPVQGNFAIFKRLGFIF